MIRAALCAAAIVLATACSQQPPQSKAADGGAPLESIETTTSAAPAAAREGAPAGTAAFDYYLLALSWSPSYCAERDNADRDRDQCASRRPFAFITHGLWPQFERGYPENCPTRQRTVDEATANAMMDIMPSRGLIRHQWSKHGVCSGLSQSAYFAQVRAFHQLVKIPAAYLSLRQPLRVTGAQVEQAFLQANPDLKADGIAVVCRGGRLREVRICFSRDAKARACGSDVRDACSGQNTMLPVR